MSSLGSLVVEHLSTKEISIYTLRLQVYETDVEVLLTHSCYTLLVCLRMSSLV